MRADSDITEIKGIGKKKAELFASLGIHTVGDLLSYYPRDYRRCPEICKFSQIIPGEACAVSFKMQRPVQINFKTPLKTAVLNAEEDGIKLKLLWYRSPYIRSALRVGERYVFLGRIRQRGEILCMEQASVYSAGNYEEIKSSWQPVYTLSRGVNNRLIQKTVRAVLAESVFPKDYLTFEERERLHLLPYDQAIHKIHFPADKDSYIRARSRLVFDEFYLFIREMQKKKSERAKKKNIFFAQGDGTQEDKEDPERDLRGVRRGSAVMSAIASLPYELTDSQKKAIDTIRTDLRGEILMRRLLQGDVGSGKTIVAFLSMLDAADFGAQAAIMAPTEILAGQHAERLEKLCKKGGIDIPVVLLTGSLSEKEKKEARESIKNLSPLFIVGTHALIQEKTEFRKLALVITDEQHRFGVMQREKLSEKGSDPHVLFMSATPIPRTLATILYGDLDVSLIRESPSHRLPIKSCLIGKEQRPAAYRFIEREVVAAHQVYVICPRIGEEIQTESSKGSPMSDEWEGDGDEGESVYGCAARLGTVLDSKIKIGILHGRMSSEEKNRVMEDFLAKNIDVLITTTVIEVGVDVGNVSVIMIEDAERFGLAQLHQLRGRVGRGDAQSYCILVNGAEGEGGRERLKKVIDSRDGFEIAEADLKMRGPGDLTGIRQSGLPDFRLADIYTDAGILRLAAEYAPEA